MRRLCFGGSFNPIHCGHIACAAGVGKRLAFDQVVLIPSARPPHKPNAANLAAAADRIAMCRLAATDEEGKNRYTRDGRAVEVAFAVDDIETRRTGPSFTIDTVRELKTRGWAEGPRQTIHWLIGADMLNFLPQWHEPLALLDEVTFHVIARPGYNFRWADLPPAFQKLQANVGGGPLVEISATEIPRGARGDFPLAGVGPPRRRAFHPHPPVFPKLAVPRAVTE